MMNPDCPECGSDRTHKATDEPADLTYRCKQCGGWFESGRMAEYYSNPTMRIQREEERARRERERRRG